jgi:hypothetical protein
MKFRVLIKGAVTADRRLSPSTADLRYVKRFLFETATRTNERVGTRLGEILGWFHAADPTLFDAQLKANELSLPFDRSITISGHAGVI